MSDDNTLTTLGSSAVGKYDNDAFESMAKNNAFISRIQLMTANSGKCKKGEFPINHYGLSLDGGEFFDLGKEVDVAILSWRPKAVDMSDDESILVEFEKDSAQFKRIQEKSEEQNSGCMWGFEYLLWLPLPGKEQFVTLFLGSKSARNVAKKFQALLLKKATVSSQEIETKKFSWFTNDIGDCNSPFELPPIEEMREQVEKFQNPPEQAVEKDDDESSNEGSRSV